MPDLAHYRRAFPELSDKQLEAMRAALRALAREVVEGARQQQHETARPDRMRP